MAQIYGGGSGGWENVVNVDDTGRLFTVGSITDMPSISVSTGSEVYIKEVIPTDPTQNNPIYKYQYSGTEVGSIWCFINSGSYVQVLTYDAGDNLISKSAWIEV